MRHLDCDMAVFAVNTFTKLHYNFKDFKQNYACFAADMSSYNSVKFKIKQKESKYLFI